MSAPVNRVADYVMCAISLGQDPLSKWSIFWHQTKNMRVRLGLGKYHPQRLFSLQTIYGQLYFRDNFGDITNLTKLLHKQTYRLKMLTHSGAILDIGANIGLAAVWFAFYNPSRPIYCFEPLADNVALIKLNCPQAKVEQLAVGASAGLVQLQVDPDSVMASNIITSWETREKKFSVIMLDEFVISQKLQEIALLKIDTEGMELDVLHGAQKTLQKTHQIIIETHGGNRHIESMSLIKEAGFGIDSEVFDGHTGMIFGSQC